MKELGLENPLTKWSRDDPILDHIVELDHKRGNGNKLTALILAKIYFKLVGEEEAKANEKP